jgi:hypothetical protein
MSGKAAARVIGLVSGTSLLGCVACAQVLGTDDYRVARPAAAGTPETPPYLTGATCESCLNDACSAVLADCSADSTCASWLASVREHPDPLSAYTRYQIEAEQFWQRDHGQVPVSTIGQLKSCAESCLGSCPIGQEYSCVGRFDWSIPYPTSLRTRVTNLQGTALPGAQVDACRDVDQCRSPLASNLADAQGFAPLALVDPGQTAEARVDSLAIQASGFRAWQWMQTRPWGTGDYVSCGLLDDGLIESWFQALGLPTDADKTLLDVVPLDCAGINAKDVTLEVWVESSNGPVQCKDCVYAYANADSVPSRELTSYSTAGRDGYVASVPPGLVHVVLRRRESPRDIVSVVPLVVQSGNGYFIKAYPASTPELAEFPDPTR